MLPCNHQSFQRGKLDRPSFLPFSRAFAVFPKIYREDLYKRGTMHGHLQQFFQKKLANLRRGRADSRMEEKGQKTDTQ